MALGENDVQHVLSLGRSPTPHETDLKSNSSMRGCEDPNRSNRTQYLAFNSSTMSQSQAPEPPNDTGNIRKTQLKRSATFEGSTKPQNCQYEKLIGLLPSESRLIKRQFSFSAIVESTIEREVKCMDIHESYGSSSSNSNSELVPMAVKDEPIDESFRTSHIENNFRLNNNFRDEKLNEIATSQMPYEDANMSSRFPKTKSSLLRKRRFSDSHVLKMRDDHIDMPLTKSKSTAYLCNSDKLMIHKPANLLGNDLKDESMLHSKGHLNLYEDITNISNQNEHCIERTERERGISTSCLGKNTDVTLDGDNGAAMYRQSSELADYHDSFAEVDNSNRTEIYSEGSKVQCVVCGEFAHGNFFGAVVCLPCKSFFIRCTKGRELCILQHCSGDCDVRKQQRNRCQYCRYKRCIAVGMSRKEKPETVQPIAGQELCKVCGDLANGIHFGVNTCEGCKKFFRRGVKEHTSYICKDNHNCCLNPRNRNNCRYCRYQKCISVGMSREAIKMGRPRKLYPGDRVNELPQQSNSNIDERSQNESSPNHFAASISHIGNSYNKSDHQSYRLENRRFPHQFSAQVVNHIAIESEQTERTKSLLPTYLSKEEPSGSNYAVYQRHGQNHDRLVELPELEMYPPYELQSKKSSLPCLTNTTCRTHTEIVSGSLDSHQFPSQRRPLNKTSSAGPSQMELSPFEIQETFALDNGKSNFSPIQLILPTSSSGNPSPVDFIEQVKSPAASPAAFSLPCKRFSNVPHIATNELMRPLDCHSRSSSNQGFNFFPEIGRHHSPVEYKSKDGDFFEETSEALDLRLVDRKSCSEWKDKRVNDGHPASGGNAFRASKRRYRETCINGSTDVERQKLNVLAYPHAHGVQEKPTSQSFPLDDNRCTVSRDQSISYNPQSNSSQKCHYFVPLHGTPPVSENNDVIFVRDERQTVPDIKRRRLTTGVAESNQYMNSESYLVTKRPMFYLEGTSSDFVRASQRDPCQNSARSFDFKHFVDSSQTITNKCDHYNTDYSTSSTNSHHCRSPELMSSRSPTSKPLSGQGMDEKKDNLAEFSSKYVKPDDEIIQTKETEGSEPFDPYSNESTFVYINEMFMVYDTFMDMLHGTPESKRNALQDGPVDTMEFTALDRMFTNAYGYSPTKVCQRWKQSYIFKVKAIGLNKESLTDAEGELISCVVQYYKDKVLLCDEDVNKPAIKTNLTDTWPARGQDRDHWVHLQDRVLRQTYAENQFVNRIADKCQVKDRRVEETSKFLGNTILMASREWFDPVRKKLKFFWNWKLPSDHPLSPLHQRITRVASHIFNLHMDHAEITLLSVLNVSSPDNEGCGDSSQMDEKTNCILKLLSHYLCSINVEPTERIPELLEMMPLVCHLSVWYSSLIKNMNADTSSIDRSLTDLAKLDHVSSEEAK